MAEAVNRVGIKAMAATSFVGYDSMTEAVAQVGILKDVVTVNGGYDRTCYLNEE